ncbi:myosin-17 [Quercus suber]|uniref:Myosin-17 n=1 Tax=Quercus suber TaxID=58331 RepID=A0AAW0LZJ1_QUESU
MNYGKLKPNIQLCFFKQQLTAFLENIYGMIRYNLKKEISPLLGFCIQVTTMLSSLPIFYYHILLLPYISFFGDFIIVKYIFLLLKTMHLSMSAPFSIYDFTVKALNIFPTITLISGIMSNR